MRRSNQSAAGRIFALVTALSFYCANTSAYGQATNVDLGSTVRDNAAATTSAIRVGNTVRVVHAGEMVTDAELAAMSQVATAGRQTLLVGAAGNAVGGHVSLNHDLGGSIGNLAIPNGISALHDFSGASAFNVAGLINNAGALYAYSSTAAVTQGTINANSILNQASGLISTKAKLAAGTLDLVLNLTGDLINHGIIESTGSLVITSPNVTNSGTITAANNINFAPTTATNFLLNNVGGNVTATAGNITVREATYAAKTDATIYGGNLHARKININTGHGAAEIHVGEIAGSLNINAGIAHVTAASPQLTLGEINLTGDPTFYNTVGDIVIENAITVPVDSLAIVAAGDILSNTAIPSALSTFVSSGNAGDINLVAGAQFTSSGPSSVFPPTGDTTSTITILGGSTIGGKIDLTGGSGITVLQATSGGGDAGDINVIAFAGTNAGSGTIRMADSGFIDVGVVGGAAGNVRLIAGGNSSGDSIRIGDIFAGLFTGATTPGSILISARQPEVGSGVTIVNGAITGGAFTPTGALSNGSIRVDIVQTSAGDITVESGNNILATTVTAFSFPGLPGASVSVSSNSASPLSIGGPTATNRIANFGSGTAAGNGGSLTILNSGSGGINVNLNLTANAAGAGTGGNIIVDATANGGTGSINVGGGATLWQANSSNGNGGSVVVKSHGAITSPTILALQARSLSAGAGGSIDVTIAGSTSDITMLSSSANNLSVNASGPNGGGNITLSAGRDINANGGAIVGAATANGNGANYTLSAGRNLSVDFVVLDASSAGAGFNGGNIALAAGNNIFTRTLDASGSGNGGTITIESNSATAYQISNTNVPNGINGALNVSGATGAGTITVRNSGSGGITHSVNAANLNVGTGGAGGTIVLDALFDGGTGDVTIGVNQILAAGGGSGQGGTIEVRGQKVVAAHPTQTVVLNAQGGPTGAGGSVTLQSIDSNHNINIASGGPGGTFNLMAPGGSTGGDGGSIRLESGGSISGSLAAAGNVLFASAPATSGQGKGGSYVLKSGANINLLGGALLASGKGAADGGSVEIETNSPFAFRLDNGVGTNNRIQQGVLAEAGLGGGSGGSLSITNNGTGGINYETPVGSLGPVANGNGYSLALDAGAGTLKLANGGSLNTSPVGTGTQAGDITLKGATIVSGAAGFSTIANGGANTGNGGKVIIATTDPLSDVTIAATDFSIDVQGGATAGDGGKVEIASGRDINVQIAFMNTAVTSGSGSSVSFKADRNVSINNPLNMNAVGSGNGGDITIESNSSTPFNITGGGINGINGGLNAIAVGNGGGGNVTVINHGSGGITSPGGFTINALGAGNTGGKRGSITLSGASLPAGGPIVLQAHGGTDGQGGTIRLVSTDPGQDISFGPANFNAQARGGTASGKGGTIEIESGRDVLAVNGSFTATFPFNGAGGDIKVTAGRDVTLAAGGFNVQAAGSGGDGGSLEVTAGRNFSQPSGIGASAAGSGHGGSVKITVNSSTPFAILPSPSVNGIVTAVQANGAGASGNGGSVEIKNLGSGGILNNAMTNPFQLTVAGNGNGGRIVLDAGSGTLFIGAGAITQNYSLASNTLGGTIQFSGAQIVVDPANASLNVGGGAGTGGSITITTTSNSTLRIGGVSALVPNITGANAGSLAVASGGDLLVTASGAFNLNGANAGATVSLTAGTTGQGNVQILGSLSPTATTTGATVAISFNDPSGDFRFGTSGPGSFVTGVIGLSGTTGGSISIANNAPAAPLTVTANNNGFFMLTGGDTTLSADGAVSVTATVNQSTNFNVNGSSFSYTQNSSSVLNLRSVNVSGGITISQPAAGSTTNVLYGGTVSAGDNVTISSHALNNNGQIITDGTFTFTGLNATTTPISGLGHIEGASITIEAANGQLQLSGSQSYNVTLPSGTLNFDAPTIAIGAGVTQTLLSNNVWSIETGTLTLNRYSKLNGTGITSLFITIGAVSSPTTLLVEDGFFATINTASSTQGSVGLNGTSVTLNSTPAAGDAELRVNAASLVAFTDSVNIGSGINVVTPGVVSFTTKAATINGTVSVTTPGFGIFIQDFTSTPAPIMNISGTGTLDTNNGNVTFQTNNQLNFLSGTDLQMPLGSGSLILQAAAISVNGVAANVFDSGSLDMTGTFGQIDYTRSAGLVTVTVSDSTATKFLSEQSGFLHLQTDFAVLETIGSQFSLDGIVTATVMTVSNPIEFFDTDISHLTLTSTAAITHSAQGDGISNIGGNLNLQTPLFVNNADLRGGFTLNISSPGQLEIAGTGTIRPLADNGQITAGSGHLIFNGNQTIDGVISFNALNAGQSVVILPGVTVQSNSQINVNTPTLDLQGTLIGNPVRLNSVLGAGTIANATGDVLLPSKLVFNGKNLAILAAGNVLAPSGLTLIDLSSKTASGGSLTILAGVSFSPAPSPVAPGLSSQTFNVTGESATGGSVLLPKVNINTSTAAAGKSGGIVYIAAIDTASNAGIVQVGSINTSATNGTGGQLTINAPGGIQTGTITTKGGAGGNVALANNQIGFTGPITIQNGDMTSPLPEFGSFGQLGTVIVNGPINTSGSVTTGGRVRIDSTKNIDVLGSITATGVNGPGGFAGGDVNITSTRNIFIKGTVDTHALNIVSSSTAGRGGGIGIFAGSGANLTIAGNVITTGGANDGLGNGGSAGTIGLGLSPTVPFGDIFVGNVSVTGFIDTRGGNSSGGNGGAGGAVTLFSGSTQILGANKGVSVNASSGTGGTPGPTGTISINTQGTQALPTNFDLTTAKDTIVALPGAMFTVGIANPVNGAAGNLVSGSAAATKANASRIVESAPFSQGTITITPTNPLGSLVPVEIDEGGTLVTITADNGNGVRTLVSPSEAIALYQVTQGLGQGINLTGGGPGFAGRTETGSTIVVRDVDFDDPLIAFKLQAIDAPFNGVTLQVTGATPTLLLGKAKPVIAGTLAMPNATTAFIDLGSGALNLPTGSAITADDTTRLVISSTAGAWNISGLLSSGEIVIGRPASSPLNITVNSPGVINGAGSANPAIILSPEYMSAFAVNFKVNGAVMASPVKFASLPLPTAFKTLAVNASKNVMLQRPVVLTFAMADPLLTAGTAFVGGTVTKATSISIKALPLKLNATTTVNTALNILDDASLTADTNVVLDAAGNLKIGDDTTIRGGILKSTAPATGLLAPTDIIKVGSVSITSNGSLLEIGNGNAITANGGNVSIIARVLGVGVVDIGDGNQVTSNGGRLFVLGGLNVFGGSNNDFYARSTTAASSLGGGMEIGAGVNTGKNLDAAFKLPKNTNPPFASLGFTTSISNTNGVIKVNKSGTGSINLSTAGPSDVILNKGAMVFDAFGAGTVTFSDSTFRTESVKPISQQQTADAEYIVDTEEDDADFDGLVITRR